MKALFLTSIVSAVVSVVALVAMLVSAVVPEARVAHDPLIVVVVFLAAGWVGCAWWARRGMARAAGGAVRRSLPALALTVLGWFYILVLLVSMGG